MSRAASPSIESLKASASAVPVPLVPPAILKPRAMVELLFSVAGPKLTHGDLAAIVKGGAEYIEQAAEHAAEVTEGVGCLVAHDADNGPGAGNFQSGESVAVLMWHMQAHFEAVAGVASAVGWAAAELACRASAAGHPAAVNAQGGAQ